MQKWSSDDVAPSFFMVASQCMTIKSAEELILCIKVVPKEIVRNFVEILADKDVDDCATHNLCQFCSLASSLEYSQQKFHHKLQLLAL